MIRMSSLEKWSSEMSPTDPALLHVPLLLSEERNDTTSDISTEATENELADNAIKETQQSPPTTSPTRSKNITVALVYALFFQSGVSMWNQSVLPAFVFLLSGKNASSVGMMTALMGCSQLFVSFPSGVLADRYRRDTILRLSSAVGIAAISINCVACWFRSQLVLAVGLSLFGMFRGMSNPSICALFADSIEDGERSKYFTDRVIARRLGVVGGRIVAIIMFVFIGDQWEVEECAAVMFIGQLLCVPAMVILWFFNDDLIVKDDRCNSDDDQDEDPEKNGVDQPIVRDAIDHASFDNFFDETEHEKTITEIAARRCCCIPSSRYIPVLVASTEIISGVASGMSVRYFTIFFLDNLNLSPSFVQILYLLTPVGGILLVKIAQYGGSTIGRCQMTCILKWIGIAFMILMILSYTHNAPVSLICAFWVLRTTFMNSTQALTKSIIMDSVPKNERAKWSALESVNTFSWSGSAALGGVLVNVEGVLFNFVVTASLQLLATIPLAVLFREKDVIEQRPSLERRRN